MRPKPCPTADNWSSAPAWKPGPEINLPAMIRIDFKDTGQGMSKEQQQRGLHRVLSSTKPKGSGLGLAIVGRIVEGHHGSIQIRSRLQPRHHHHHPIPRATSPTGVGG
jgi:signal transduction histidine kinase